MVTLDDLHEQATTELKHAERLRSRCQTDIREIRDQAKAENRQLTRDERNKIYKFEDLIEDAAGLIAKTKMKLANVAKAREAEDAVQDTAPARTASFRAPSAEFIRQHNAMPGGIRIEVEGGAGSDRASSTRWVRTNDRRPAVVPSGTRFADHEIVQHHASNRAAADVAVVGQHGSLGNMVRAMTTTSGSAIVPTVWMGDIIDRARNLSAVLRAGAEIVPMDAKVVQIGRLTTDPTSAFRAEGSPITASDPIFDNVTLTAKTMSALVVGSLEWFQDADNVDEVVSNAIASSIATQLDLQALFGGVVAGGEGFNFATPPNPRGVLASLLADAASSVLGSAANGTAQTAATFYAELLDTLYTPRYYNEEPNALIANAKLFRLYAGAADTTNQPLRAPADVENIQKFMSNQIPSFTQGTGANMTDVFAGDFTQLILGQRLDVSIQTLTERYAENGQIGIVAHYRGDVALARPRAFAVYRYLKGAA